MRTHRFLVLLLVLLALVCMGLLATPRASARMLQPPPPPQSDGTCTPHIKAIATYQDTPRMITIQLDECAQRLILDGSTPNDILMFEVTYQEFNFAGLWSVPYEISWGSTDGSIPGQVEDATVSAMRTIVADELPNLVKDYAACGNTNATLITWGHREEVTKDNWFQQLVAHAAVQTGCNSSLTPGA